MRRGALRAADSCVSVHSPGFHSACHMPDSKPKVRHKDFWHETNGELLVQRDALARPTLLALGRYALRLPADAIGSVEGFAAWWRHRR